MHRGFHLTRCTGHPASANGLGSRASRIDSTHSCFGSIKCISGRTQVPPTRDTVGRAVVPNLGDAATCAETGFRYGYDVGTSRSSPLSTSNTKPRISEVSINGLADRMATVA
jgi:hypothetical protein